MSGRAIAVAVLLVGIGGLAVSNWWSYLQEDDSLRRRAAGTSAAASPGPQTATAVGRAAGSNIVPVLPLGPEPPKRPPRSGPEWNDPFYSESADVVMRFPKGVKPPSKPAYVVDLILIEGARRRASINGTLYAAGDWIGPLEVARIERDGVILRNGDGKDLFVSLVDLKSEKS